MPEDNPPTSAIRGLLLYAAIATPIAVIIALVASGFLWSWQGTAASVRPANEADEPTHHLVLIVDAEGDSSEHRWPVRAIDGLKLPVNRRALPPVTLREDLPQTTKRWGSLSFDVVPAEGPTRRIATTSPQALAVAGFLWFLGIFLRNMWVSGSPFDINPRPNELPTSLPAAGTPTRQKEPAQYSPPSPGRGGRKKKKKKKKKRR